MIFFFAASAAWMASVKQIFIVLIDHIARRAPDRKRESALNFPLVSL